MCARKRLGAFKLLFGQCDIAVDSNANMPV
jgi:hypothetical protein